MKRVGAAALWEITAAHKNRRKAYFFSNDEYTRWDIGADCEDQGYPKKIKDEWPGIWADGFDAVVVWPVAVEDSTRNGQKRRKAYFFKGLSYIRWDIKADEKDGAEQSIPANWSHWPDGWTKVDAVIAYGEDRLFFFSGKQYAHFEVEKDQFTWVRSIADYWPGLPASGIDAAVNWPGAREGYVPVLGGPAALPWMSGTDYAKAYFFFGSEYCRYDISQDKLEKGYPRDIERWWPARSFGVYVALDVPTRPNEDARLHDDQGDLDRRYIYPEGSPRGQAGWAWGLNLSGIHEIATTLAGGSFPAWLGGERIELGTVTRLGIMAHGLPGQVYAYGTANKTLLLSAQAIEAGSGRVLDDCLAIEAWLAKDATVLLMSCRAGVPYVASSKVPELLVALSKIWPGRRVVGFWTIGYAHAAKMDRRKFDQTSTTEAGMRDTDSSSDAVTISGAAKDAFEARVLAAWNDLDKLPWGSEESPHARVALNGKLIRDTPAP